MYRSEYLDIPLSAAASEATPIAVVTYSQDNGHWMLGSLSMQPVTVAQDWITNHFSTGQLWSIIHKPGEALFFIGDQNIGNNFPVTPGTIDENWGYHDSVRRSLVNAGIVA